MSGEADTCRKFVVPALQAAGWDTAPHEIAEQRTFTDGRVLPSGNGAKRRKGKRADYLLRFTSDLTLAVVEAKAAYKHAADGLQQAKDYAGILGVRFAYSTNGKGIIEADLTTGVEREIAGFPTPDELWTRLALQRPIADRLLSPTYPLPGKRLRYYQDIAINRAVYAGPDTSHAPVVHLGSEGDRLTVMANNIREFLALLAIGYDELGFDDLEQPPGDPESAERLREWLLATYGISAPATGAEIVRRAQLRHPDFEKWVVAAQSTRE